MRANAEAFADCGGYVVANSHHGVATITGDNIEAMCRAAKGYAFHHPTIRQVMLPAGHTEHAG